MILKIDTIPPHIEQRYKVKLLSEVVVDKRVAPMFESGQFPVSGSIQWFEWKLKQIMCEMCCVEKFSRESLRKIP